MKLLLVDPPFHAFLDYDRWWFSLACAQLAACARARGIEAWVYDADRYGVKDPLTRSRAEMLRRQPRYRAGVDDESHPAWASLRGAIESLRPDAIGLTSWTCKHRSLLRALRVCREAAPSARLVVGGYHASALPEPLLREPLVDGLLAGPAEQLLPDWILGGCTGRFHRAAGLPDVARLPPPDRGALLFPERYTADDMGMIMTSRGCPYDCAFCSNRSQTGSRHGLRAAASVRAEIADLVDRYGIRRLTVADADFLCRPRHALEMAEVFHSFGLPWNCEGRLDAVTDALLDRLLELGLATFSCGVETGTDEGLRRLRKGITTDQARKAARLLNARGVTWKCFFIVGFPFDTLESFEQTRLLALELAPSAISLNAFAPLPGTDLFEEARSAIEAAAVELPDFNQLNPVASLMPGVTLEAYRAEFERLLADFDAYNASRRALGDFR